MSELKEITRSSVYSYFIIMGLSILGMIVGMFISGWVILFFWVLGIIGAIVWTVRLG